MKINWKKFTTLLFVVVVGVVTLESCSDEDEMFSRNVTDKTKVVRDLSLFEENDYSAEEIFKKTAEFSKQLKDDCVPDMNIKDAVILMETYWGYGVVTKQERRSSASYTSQNFRFTVALKSDGMTIDGRIFQNSFQHFIANVKAAMGNRVLNAGDVSVVEYTKHSVTFNLRILPYNGLALTSIDPNTVPSIIYAIRQPGETVSVIAGISYDPNILSWPYSENQDVPEIPYFATRSYIGMFWTNMKTRLTTTDATLLYILDSYYDGEDLLNVKKNTNGTYDSITSSELEDHIIPSYIDYIPRSYGTRNFLVSFTANYFRANTSMYDYISDEFGLNSNSVVRSQNPPNIINEVFYYEYGLLFQHKEDTYVKLTTSTGLILSYVNEIRDAAL